MASTNDMDHRSVTAAMSRDPSGARSLIVKVILRFAEMVPAA